MTPLIDYFDCAQPLHSASEPAEQTAVFAVMAESACNEQVAGTNLTPQVQLGCTVLGIPANPTLHGLFYHSTMLVISKEAAETDSKQE